MTYRTCLTLAALLLAPPTPGLAATPTAAAPAPLAAVGAVAAVSAVAAAGAAGAAAAVSAVAAAGAAAAVSAVAAAGAAGTAGTVAAAPAAPAPQFAWPQGARAAVSLAYDDALDSQLDIAIPTLDRYGLKGSFYLQLSNPAVDKRLDAWRRAAANGHELGNHSLFHQCSRSAPGHDWVQPQRDLDTTTAAQMQDQVRLGNTMLYAIDGRRQRTYTVPCGDQLAAGANYLPGLRDSFVAIKVSGTAVTPAMATLDPYAVGVAAPEGLSGAQLIAIVQQAAGQGSMVNFTFHGVGGDYLSTSAQAHEELVRYLAANRQLYWTDTFLNIMTYVKKQRGDH